jgi:K+-sensing histidine kinase KdpD
LLWPVLGPEIPFLFLWPAVILAARYGGLGPGLMVTALSVVAEDLLLVRPDSSRPVGREDLAGMVLFGLLGAVVSVLAARLRRARQQADSHAEELARQREWLRVTLAGIGDAVLATDAEGRVAFLNPVATLVGPWRSCFSDTTSW